MKTRKIVLASACLVLLVIAIIQTVSGHIDPVKVVQIKEEIDEIRIDRPEGLLNLKKSGGDWIIDGKYTANLNEVESIADAFAYVKLLGKVTKTDNEEVLAKYDLNEENACKVSVFHNGEELRSFRVGKATSTNSQVYLMMDNSTEVYMAAGSIQNECTKSINELRSRSVFQLSKDEMVSVTVKPVDGNAWTITRGGEGNVWTASGEGVDSSMELDAESTSAWFNGCAFVAATEWLGDNESIPAEKIFDIEIKLDSKTVSLELFQADDEDGTDTYWGRSSESPYGFKLAKYTVDKYRKNPEDFSK